jgi:rhomboid protease GluP
MEHAYPQRGPAPGRTWLRLGDRFWELDDAEWERWVRSGWIPPEAMILSQVWSKGLWRRAGTLEVYHLFRPSEPSASVGAGSVDGARGGLGVASVAGAGGITQADGDAAAKDASGLPSALWGSGLSVTQILVMINLLVSAALVWAWRDDYSDHLWLFSTALRSRLTAGWVPVLFLPLFLHASAGHLMGNMVGLTAAGAAVEEFYGRWRTVLLYFAAGICGAVLSLLRAKPMLSVGASGAIMGLYGVTLVFLLRYRRRFSARQRWKTTRVYFPLLVLALLPSLFMADVYAHVGGFVGGVAVALLIPPREDRLSRLEGPP